jgi:hypothetical protein
MIDIMITTAEQNTGKVDVFTDTLALRKLAEPTVDGFVDHTFINSDVRVVRGDEDAAITIRSDGTPLNCSHTVGAYAVHFSHESLHRATTSSDVSSGKSARVGCDEHFMVRWRRRYVSECQDTRLREKGHLYVPRLGFTGPGVWPLNGSGVQLRRFRADTVWSDALGVTAGDDVQFVISGFDSARGCGELHPVGVLVWIESIDKRVVLSAAALPDDDINTGEFLVSTRVLDPGEYRVHIAGHGRIVLEEGAHGTQASILPVAGSPWTLVVKGNGWTRGDPTRIIMPTQRCETADLTRMENGRWVECEAAGIAPEICLSDGWIFVPNHCSFPLLTGPGALKTAAVIAAARGGRPVWVVVASSSISRGTVHSMIDLVSGLGMIEDPTISVARALFGHGKETKPGEGSTLKCWGWADVQIGA